MPPPSPPPLLLPCSHIRHQHLLFLPAAAALPIPMSHHVLLLIPVPAPIHLPPSLSPTGKKILPKVRYYILFLLDELKQPSSSPYFFTHVHIGMNFPFPSAVDEFLFPFNPIPFHSLEFASFNKMKNKNKNKKRLLGYSLVLYLFPFKQSFIEPKMQ
jgi:hypothetical protein